MIVYCPVCYQPARLPSGDGDPLNCPHCSAEVVFEAEHFTGPTYLPITESTPHSEGIGANSFEYKIDQDRHDADAPSLIEANFEDDYELAPEHDESFESNESQNILNEVQIANANLRRRKPKSAVGGLVGVVLGGVLAFPIATAIVWYGFGRDPFQVAPYVVKYVPWIVPEKLGGGSVAQRANRQYSPAPSISRPELSSDKSSHELPSVGSLAESDDTSTDVIEYTGDDQQPNTVAQTPSTDSTTSSLKPTSGDIDVAAEPTSDLPFKSDTPPSDRLDNELQAALDELETSYDQMLQAKDEASIASFLDAWQVYSEMLYQTYLFTGTPKLAGLEKKLTDLNDRALLTKLIDKSKARLSEAGKDTSIGYVDVFELTNVESGPRESLVRLVPTDRNREPIKSMKVLAPAERFPLESKPGQNQRFFFLGFVTKARDGGQNEFYVLMSRPL